MKKFSYSLAIIFYGLIFNFISFITQAQNLVWNQEAIPTQMKMREIEFIPQAGWMAVGDSGLVFLRQSTGWVKITSPTTAGFFAIEYLNFTPSTGKCFLIAENQQVFCFRPDSLDVVADTLPGWSDLPCLGNQLVNLNITNSTEYRYGLPCDSGKLFAFKTVWSPPTFEFQFSTQKEILDLYPFNAWNILAIGDSGKIWRTVGLDNPFSRVSLNLTSNRLHRIFGKGNSNIWVAGNGGVLLFSSNSGLHWQLENSSTTADLFGGTASDSAVWVVGSGGEIIASYDNGGTWQTENSGTQSDILSIKANGTEVFACGENGLILYLNRVTDLQPKNFWEELSASLKQNQLIFNQNWTGKWELWSVDGRKLASQSVQQSYQSRVESTLAPGFYFIRVQPENNFPKSIRLIVGEK